MIVTAHGSIPNAVAAMRLGAIDFLSKPLTPDTLRRVAAEVLAPPRSRQGGGRTPPKRLDLPSPPPRNSPPTSLSPNARSTAASSTKPRST